MSAQLYGPIQALTSLLTDRSQWATPFMSSGISVGLDLHPDFKAWICCSFCNISACAYDTVGTIHKASHKCLLSVKPGKGCRTTTEVNSLMKVLLELQSSLGGKPGMTPRDMAMDPCSADCTQHSRSRDSRGQIANPKPEHTLRRASKASSCCSSSMAPLRASICSIRFASWRSSASFCASSACTRRLSQEFSQRSRTSGPAH